MSKTVTISIRTTEELKAELTKIAKEKDTSLNDVTSSVLAEFVENYKLEQVKDNEIPSAEQIKKQIKASRDRIIQSYKDSIKIQLSIMAENAQDTISTDIFRINNEPYELREEISSNIKKELEGLGYYVFIYDDKSEDDAPYTFYPLEMVISLNSKMPAIHQEIEHY